MQTEVFRIPFTHHLIVKCFHRKRRGAFILLALSYNWTRSHGPSPVLDTYTWQPMPNKTWKDLVPLLCPIGPGGAKYTSDAGANFIVKNKCRPFCPWTVVDDDDKVLAKAAKPGMCTNGLMFCACPLCLMAGQAKTFMIFNGEGAEVLTLQQSLYPCWSIISCEGVALFLGAVADCKEFVTGHTYGQIGT